MVIVVDADLSGGITPDFFTAVSIGSIPGYIDGGKIGQSDTIPSTTFILLSNLTNATRVSNFPAATQQMQVVSSSVLDTAAGTGAQQVELTYLTEPGSPSGFKQFTEIITLNGTTPVLTVATNINRIERFRVSRTGTGQVSAGNISLQSVGGATTFELIPGGENLNRTAVHFVQNGYKSIITDILLGVATSGGVRFSITTVESDDFGNIVRIGQLEIQIAQGSSTISLNKPIAIINDQNRRLSFAITVRGLAANQAASGSFNFIDIPI